MTRNNAYTERLSRIIFNSADVLPDEVRNYLKKIASSNLYEAKKTILKDVNIYSFLADFLPKDYVDCLLDILIKKPIRKKTNIPSNPPELSPELIERLKSSGMTEDEIPLMFTQMSNPGNDDVFEDFGIEEYNTVFLPSAPIQGPFIYVLNKHEDEGLRLIQTLTNSAVKTWCENQHKLSLTPVPVTINLLSGERKFWGDSEVYCWYRGKVNAPYSVMSSLMALEYWMEKQIETGRDVEEVFEKVLLGSDCVAVLGICVAMTIAYPNKCLKALLPIISSPAVWQMDVRRLPNDLSNLKFSEEENWIYKYINESNQKPYRKLEIRKLAIYYLFYSNDSLRTEFEEAVAQFSENLPFRYEEDRENGSEIADLQERMENYQVYGKPENYRFRQIGEQECEWWIEPPEEIKQRNEKLLASNYEYQRYLGLSLWARKTIEKGRVDERLTLEEAVKTAQEFQQPDDFSSTSEKGDSEQRWMLVANKGASIDLRLSSSLNTVSCFRFCLRGMVLLPIKALSKSFWINAL